MPVGPTELIIILVIVVIIFGAGKLSSLGGALGSSVREFRTSVKDDDEVEVSTKPQIEQL